VIRFALRCAAKIAALGEGASFCGALAPRSQGGLVLKGSVSYPLRLLDRGSS
jgi:hypothetical protein